MEEPGYGQEVTVKREVTYLEQSQDFRIGKTQHFENMEQSDIRFRI